MEKMVLLLLAMFPIGSYVVHLRLNGPFIKNVRLSPEVYFLSPSVPAFAIENLKKASPDRIRLNLPDFIFHVKNTSKIFFSPGFKPKFPGGKITF